jgi:putative intracellular protease/amidase
VGRAAGGLDAAAGRGGAGRPARAARGSSPGTGAPWSEFTVTDRNLITGQNPGSAAAVARQLVTALGR